MLGFVLFPFPLCLAPFFKVDKAITFILTDLNSP